MLTKNTCLVFILMLLVIIFNVLVSAKFDTISNLVPEKGVTLL